MPLTAYRARMARLRALEATYTPKLRRALLLSAEAAISAVEAGAGPLLAEAYVSDKQLIAVLAALYVDCGVGEATIEYDQLTEGLKALPGVGLVATWGQRLRKFITTEGAAAVKGIAETTRKVVRTVLNDAAQAGSSIPETVKALREKIASLAVKRARLIARTELITAANVGSYLGASATGLALRKKWLATPGPRTRATHHAANGQTVGMEETFVVGGYAARYAGDPLLPAKERCNCRCSLTYVPA